MSDGYFKDHLIEALKNHGAVTTDVGSSNKLKMLLAGADAANVIADAAFADVLRDWAKSQTRLPDLTKQVWTMLMPEERRRNPDLLKPPFAGYFMKPVRDGTLLKMLSRSNETQIGSATSALRNIVGKAKSPRRLRILVADDNPINLLLTRTMLEKLGHRVAAVTDGLQVLSYREQGKPFDVLFLDVEMPAMNGYETARAIRASEQSAAHLPAIARLPIIALTAHVRQEDLDLCLSAGMDQYLVKPFDQHELTQLLQDMAGVRKAS